MCFIRPHLELVCIICIKSVLDVIYGQSNLSYLTSKIQYKTALTITGAIRGTPKKEWYQELGFEFLKDTRWLEQLCYLYKIVSTKQAAFYYDLIPPFCRAMSFKNYFLPYAIKEWNKLDPKIRNAESYASFRNMLLNFIKLTGNSTYRIHDSLGIKLLTRFASCFQPSLGPQMYT